MDEMDIFLLKKISEAQHYVGSFDHMTFNNSESFLRDRHNVESFSEKLLDKYSYISEYNVAAVNIDDFFENWEFPVLIFEYLYFDIVKELDDILSDYASSFDETAIPSNVELYEMYDEFMTEVLENKIYKLLSEENISFYGSTAFDSYAANSTGHFHYETIVPQLSAQHFLIDTVSYYDHDKNKDFIEYRLSKERPVRCRLERSDSQSDTLDLMLDVLKYDKVTSGMHT